MTEHLTPQEVDAFHLRTINAAERRRLDAHIATCDECLQSVAKPDSAFAALGEAFLPSLTDHPFHLAPAELRKYVEDAGDEADRVIYNSHLQDCPECTRKAEELAVELLPTKVRARASVPELPWWNRLPSLWSSPGRLNPVRVVAIVVVLGALLAVALLWQRQREPGDERAEQGSQVSPTQPPGNSTIEEPTPITDPPKEDVKDLVVTLKDNGIEIGLDQQGNLIGLKGIDSGTQQTIAGVLAGKSLPKPEELKDLAAPPIALMDGSGQGPSFNLTRPLGVVTTDDRPLLSWQALPAATSYTVSIFDEDFNQVATSAPQPGTTWRVNKSLPRGAVYSWQVKALKDGQEITSPVAPARRAQFKVLDQEKLRELTKLRRQRPASHIALGVTYARFGLLSEAEREFQLLVQANPDSSVAKKLLRNVQEWLRNEE